MHLSEMQHQDFWHRGWMVVESVFAVEEVDSIAQLATRLCERELYASDSTSAADRSNDGLHVAPRKMGSPFTKSPEFAKFVLDPRLRSLVKKLTGQRALLCVDQIMMKPPHFGLTNSVSLSMIQLHGSESPERVSEIRTHTGLSVMKAISIETEEDLDQIDNFNLVADWLLFDAKPNRNISSAMPGGNAISFDWNLLKNYSGDLPWMLSGGLNDKNVAEAVKITKAYHVDVSSGVEDVPGSKSQQKIRSFLDATRLL